MDFVIDFIYVENADAIIIWGRIPNNADYVFFLDGGKTGDGEKVVKHYQKWIEPNLQYHRAVGLINSHPHEDHINGLLEIVEIMKNKFSFAIYNDPIKFISSELKSRIHSSYLKDEDRDINHLYKTFEEIEKLNRLCANYGIRRYDAFDNINFFDGAFKIVSPSIDFYKRQVQQFTDIDFLKRVDFSKKTTAEINDLDEGNIPCAIVDEKNDATPENLTSTVIQLTDSLNRKYLLTGDAGVDSFDSAEKNGFDLSACFAVQLPHHGSRRNINTNWICRFNPTYFIASAIGSNKHPRKAVINCIKRNLSSKVYSTHTSKGIFSETTNKANFPSRGWSPAIPL